MNLNVTLLNSVEGLESDIWRKKDRKAHFNTPNPQDLIKILMQSVIVSVVVERIIFMYSTLWCTLKEYLSGDI